MLIDLLVTMHIICSAWKCLPNVAYPLQQATPIFGHYLPLATVPPNLHTITFECFPSFYYHLLTTTFLWQPLAY